MLDVEQWAELRREHFVRGVAIKELVRRTGLSRNTIRVALRSDAPPAFCCPERASKLDPFKDEIHRLLKDDPKLTGVRVGEEIEPLGFDGGQTIVDDYLISFSGELAYEINTSAWDGPAVWEAILAAGEPFGITPYGTESMHVLRAEKGYPIIGQDTDGTVTPQDLGMEWVVSKKKADFVGLRSFTRPDTSRPDRKQLVGLLPADPDELLPEGAQLVEPGEHAVPIPMLGHVTSSYHSTALGRTFALALVRSGRDRVGQTVHAALCDRTVPVAVIDPVLYDPEGSRRDG